MHGAAVPHQELHIVPLHMPRLPWRLWESGSRQALGLLSLQQLVDGVAFWSIHFNLVKHWELKAELQGACVYEWG